MISIKKSACVHCRIGSLEAIATVGYAPVIVHCRIGSLEVKVEWLILIILVHCRIGSLEECALTNT